ncbi:MAG: GNAT family N-acetyltransferase [Cyanobacteria bacterium P01_D01_bin.1]
MPDAFAVPNYRLEAGSALDRARLVKFMQRAYRDLGATETGTHLADTVNRHFTASSKLWWLIGPRSSLSSGLPGLQRYDPVGCLWLGESIDQRNGHRQAYVFLVYVEASHRRQGLGSALMQHAHQWAKEQNYQQINLQVFEDNAAALNLYQKLGYKPQARWMSLDIR